jgi:predicted nucleic acid-binding protein
MPQFIVLDSGPLGLILQELGYHQADQCREWLKRHLAAGTRVIVPEIVDYEIRRELLRLNKSGAVAKLDAFEAPPGRYLHLNTADLRVAAELWAQARQQGRPTADPHALDIDVILAAQALSVGVPPADFVVATTNVAHLARFVPAQHWSRI